MVPPSGSGRALETTPREFDLRPPPADVRPGRAPLATTIVLFAVVGVLLAFIAWR